MLRLVSGKLGGRRLVAPRDAATRPTSEKVREAVFSILGAPGEAVLDLYAGSGALGLEALSRGAARLVLVENRRPALDALRANLTSLGLGEPAVTVVPRPVERSASSVAPLGPFDLVVADPPYALVESGAAQRALEGLLGAGGSGSTTAGAMEIPP
ncbi:MAG: 16S rRNA (guanine(966)-N(2))-methyltransferase RsmD [Myxococcales bacterium]|nr:MAG: 16S rRNA (guanine(966)-N(2))-methyltransferase RsmD [Myxococcales bacterium]